MGEARDAATRRRWIWQCGGGGFDEEELLEKESREGCWFGGR